jgi:hypothetical protein
MFTVFIGLAFNAVPVSMDSAGCFVMEAHFDKSVPVAILEAFIAKNNNTEDGIDMPRGEYESRTTFKLVQTECIHGEGNVQCFTGPNIIRARLCVIEKIKPIVVV